MALILYKIYSLVILLKVIYFTLNYLAVTLGKQVQIFRRTTLGYIALIVVVMQHEAIALCAAAAFERKAGQPFIRVFSFRFK